jgi:LPXTG-motif cell wall-anchored protein
MVQMFNNCQSLESLDLSSFDTSKVTSMNQMFCYCYKLATLKVSSFDTSNVTDMAFMFFDCQSLKSLDLSNFYTPKLMYMTDMFYDCYALQSLDVSNFNTSNITDMGYLFGNCKSLESLDLTSFDTSNVTNMQNMFSTCLSLIKVDISSFNTGNVTDMSSMFYWCPVLKELDLSNFDTSSVTSMSYMFAYDYYLETLKVSSFNTSNVNKMSYMFSNCQQVTELDVSGFDTSNVTKMENMFEDCYNLQSLDLSSFNTSNVTTMKSMFENCYSFKEIDISNFDLSNVTTMAGMFKAVSETKKIILPKSHTPNLTDVSEMFYYCFDVQELDLSSFDITDDTTQDYMFFLAVDLEKVTLGPNVILNGNSWLWSTLRGGIYLSEDGEDPSNNNYIGNEWNLYSYQANSENRVDEQGNEKANVYRICTVVAYDPNGGTWSNGSTGIKYTYYKPGEVWTMTLEQPVNSGSTFMGWDRIQDYTASLYDLKTSFVSTGCESTIMLYADWEGRDRLAYNTTDSVDGEAFATVEMSGDNATATECEFSIKALDGAPEPTKTDVTVSFNGEGSQGIDFGTITFLRTGLYHYEITQSSADSDGWVYNNGSKIVNITVSKDSGTGEVYISSLEGVKFYNYYNGGKRTKDLVEQDKADNVQKNHQQNAEGNESLYKSANWTNQETGEANINIVYNNTYSDTESTTALYIFTNCTAHNFTKDIAKQNIKFLLNYYDTVVAVCSMKTKPLNSSDVTYEKFVFKSSDPADDIDEQLDLYLNTIDFRVDMHLSAVWQLSCFDTCLDMFEPDAVFFSYDGARGYDQSNDIMTQEIFGMSAEEFANAKYPEPILKHYDETLEKLAEILKRNEFYIMIANGTNVNSQLSSKDYDTFNTTRQELKNMTYLAMMTIDPLTMSTEEGRNKIKAEIDAEDNGINIRDYVATELSTYATEIYSYAQTIESTVKLKISEKYSITDVIDPRFNIAGDITVKSAEKQSDGSYVVLKKGEDYTLTITDDAASGGKKVQVNFIKWNGIPAEISIPVVLKDVSKGFYDMNGGIEDFADTNVGDVKVTVTDTVYDGSTGETSDANPRVSIQTESPKLFLDTDYIVSTIGVLPETGGIGIGIYIVGGLTLMILAAYVWKKQLERER